MTGKIDVVSKLLQRGASSNIKNEFGQTPEKIAELGRHEQVVEIIRKHGKK
jgi:ankyrin repeat protein